MFHRTTDIGFDERSNALATYREDVRAEAVGQLEDAGIVEEDDRLTFPVLLRGKMQEVLQDRAGDPTNMPDEGELSFINELQATLLGEDFEGSGEAEARGEDLVEE